MTMIVVSLEAVRSWLELPWGTPVPFIHFNYNYKYKDGDGGQGTRDGGRGTGDGGRGTGDGGLAIPGLMLLIPVPRVKRMSRSLGSPDSVI